MKLEYNFAFCQGNKIEPILIIIAHFSTNNTVLTTEEPRSANELPTSGPTASERSALRSLARRYRARRRRKMRADNTDPAERRKRKRASKYINLLV